MSDSTPIGRPLTFYRTRLCLSDQCGQKPFAAGYCRSCYYKRYRKDLHQEQAVCHVAGCGRKPAARGYCYLCCKIFVNTKPRKSRKKIKERFLTDAPAQVEAPVEPFTMPLQ